MNESGTILEKWADDFQLSPDEFLIVYDDFSLDRGTIRIRPSGSPGGHNGMKDIINRLGTNNIPRIRIGIGPVPTNETPSDFVLSSVHPDDRPIFKRVLSEIPDIIETICEDGIEESMNRWNGVNFNERVG